MNIEEVINVLKNKDNSKELYFCEKIKIVMNLYVQKCQKKYLIY